MKTIFSIILLTITLSTQAMKLRTLAITPERLKLIQENSSININHQKINDSINETPTYKIRARNGHPAYRSYNTKSPQMTLDRTRLESSN